MISEVVRELFWSFFKFIFAFVIVILLLIGGFSWVAGSYTYEDENIFKTKKQINPDVEINIRTVNGVQTSDTTYIYNLKK